jgi:hypothetical protein
MYEAVQQRDAADEGRLDACGSIIVGSKVIVNEGEVVRPSQLIASVRQTLGHRSARITQPLSGTLATSVQPPELGV